MTTGWEAPSFTTAGTPTARAPGGTTIRLGTTALAPTVAPEPTTAWWSTTEPDPTSDPSSSRQPSRWARWPTTHPSPTTVGKPGPQWTTVPSWIEVRSPMVMLPRSPRSTAQGQIDESAPMVTSPITAAWGCT